MGVSDQCHSPATSPQGNKPGTQWMEGRVAPRAGLDSLTKRKIPCRNTKLKYLHFKIYFSTICFRPCDELITRPEEPYRLWCVVVCDLQTSWMSRPWPSGGNRAQKQTTNKSTKWYFRPGYTYRTIILFYNYRLPLPVGWFIVLP
jgi:hypothetical protein